MSSELHASVALSSRKERPTPTDWLQVMV